MAGKLGYIKFAGLGCSFLLAVSGCKGLFSPKGLPDDPLFVTRQPVAMKPIIGPPVQVANFEPTLPTYPMAKKETSPVDTTRQNSRPAQVQGILTNQTKKSSEEN